MRDFQRAGSEQNRAGKRDQDVSGRSPRPARDAVRPPDRREDDIEERADQKHVDCNERNLKDEHRSFPWG